MWMIVLIIFAYDYANCPWCLDSSSTYPAQAIKVTQAYGDQDKTNTMMTTKAIFASFHSFFMD